VSSACVACAQPGAAAPGGGQLLEASIVLLIAVSLLELRSKRGLAWAAAAALLGFAAEYVGVNMGMIFGNYRYSPGAPLIGGVHPLVPLAWAAVVHASMQAASTWGRRRPLVAAAYAVLFDLAVDPIASTVFHIWEWGGGGPTLFTVPLENFAAWFVLAYVMALLYERMCGAPRGYASQAVIMGVIGLHIALGAPLCGYPWCPYWAAAAVGVLAAYGYSLSRRWRRASSG